jgi:two-component system chemotaxis sensor kinase CheA
MEKIDESGERKRSFNDKEKVEIKEKVSFLNNKFYDFMRVNRLIIEMANHALLSDDSNLYISTKDMINFLSKNFGKDSKVFRDFEKKFILRPISGTFERFETVVNEISHSQGKFVGLQIKDTKLQFNPDDYSGFLSSCVHLFRNAVDHGIEEPKERIDKNKPERGTIDVSFEGKDNNFFKVKVRDDGRGISPDKIKRFALKLGFKKEEELQKLSDKDVIQLIFNQGFSSKEEVSKVSGRGVGMDALKIEAEKIGGKVWVESEVDIGTTFFAELPFSIKSKKARSS